MQIKAIQSKHGSKLFYVAIFPAGLLCDISYASIRRQDDEEGAVQRVLSTRRISRLAEFAREKGDYPNSVVLNWVNDEHPLSYKAGKISVTEIENSAQIIDGQHRIAGIKEARNADNAISNIPVAVTIYEYLNTKECAELFIAINTEQRQAPKSLVFDLFPLVEDSPFADPDTVRSVDIATLLHEDQNSPLYGHIKFPADKSRGQKVQLSTVVTAIKPLLGDAGEFSQMKIRSFELQRTVILNYLETLRDKYGKNWESAKNPFLYALGFQAAVVFLRNRLLPICQNRKDFSSEMFRSLMNITEEKLIFRDEIKGMQGRAATRYIVERLEDSLTAPTPDEESFKF